ncbi:MAG: DUF429 domain-containing protein, partial [Alphaproteobacteria bacterium]|nr:DUF429 domain-containing protein [Alphaproteobacteria bacterium]
MSNSSAGTLAISSTVAVGHVGLSAIIPTFHLIGQTVAAIPTILLSNHPGLPHVAGTRIERSTMAAMLDAIEQNGWLGGIQTVLTGYLPSPDHVDFAADAIDRIRAHNAAADVIIDPVIGDDPKGLYVDEAAAEAVRTRLLPRADIVLPNRFELAWLSGCAVNTAGDAVAAARLIAPRRTIAKSIPAGDGMIANIEVTATTETIITIARHQGVPNGTGDMFSALIAAGYDLQDASDAMEAVITASLGNDHLAIVAAAERWRHPGRAQDRRQPATPSPEPGKSSSQLSALTTIPDKDQQSYVAGADGCPGGWIAVYHPVDRPNEAASRLFSTFAEFLNFAQWFAAIAVDIPIGLPDVAAPGGRAADRKARAVLGARRSSVFAVPARAAIACTDYFAACKAALAHSDPPRKVAKQTFHLFPKIREVDQALTPELQERLVECHPEVAFWAMNSERPLTEPKKAKSAPYAPGLELRRQLLAAHGYDPNFLAGTPYLRRHVAPDDFLDACATAWTANRLTGGKSRRFP